MLGLIHRILLRWVEDTGGPDAVARVLDSAGIPGDRTFRMNEPYDDAEFMSIFRAACGQFDLSEERAQHYLARVFFEDARQRFPRWFEMCDSSRQFLEMQPVIHNGFATGLQDPTARKAVTDKFHVDSADDRLVVRYSSPNRLCVLYIALAQLVLAHYGEPASVTELQCARNGADCCEIVVQWF